jgi:hypothetical protein
VSNLPPGVTGNEYQIAGPDFERDEERICPSEGFSTLTITGYGKERIESVIALLNEPEPNILVAVHHLRSALGDIWSVDLDGECPFAGDVTVVGYQGTQTWECPVCREVHAEEI